MSNQNPTQESVFQIESEQDVSRTDYYKRVFDIYVLSSVRVLLSDWRAIAGFSIIGLYLLMGTVGVYLIEVPSVDEGPYLVGAFQQLAYPFGTDSLGQDLFALVIHSTPMMLKMAFSGAIFATVVATIVGTFSGYSAGTGADRVLSTTMDTMIALPGLPLLIVIAAVFQPKNPFLIGIILSINYWAGLGRAVRSEVLSLRGESFVEASQILGQPTRSIIVKDIIPNIMPFILINFVNTARAVIFNSVALYFLGILPYTNLNWGVMLNEAYTEGGIYGWNTAHWILTPLFTIILLSLGLILISQSADALFNAQLRARHAKTSSSSPGEESTDSVADSKVTQ